MEPDILSRGKEFHKRVQLDWLNTASGDVKKEHNKDLTFGTPDASRRVRRGRLDLFIDLTGEADGYVVVTEIKSTDWDRIAPHRVRPLLHSHRRQVWKYIEQYLDGDGLSVMAGLIYPREPSSTSLRDSIEAYLNEHSLQCVWYDSPPPSLR
jgi:hypothetical protein